MQKISLFSRNFLLQDIRMRVKYPLFQTTSSTKIIFIYNFSTNLS